MSLADYHQPPAGNTEKFIGIRIPGNAGGVQSTYQALKDYPIDPFGRGLPVVRTLMHHVIRTKLGGAMNERQDWWHRSVVVRARCQLIHLPSGRTFDDFKPSSLEEISPEFAREEGETRRRHIAAYVDQIRAGKKLLPPLYVTGAMLNLLGAKTDSRGLFMLDGARRLSGHALAGIGTLEVLLLMLEDEWAALIPTERRTGLGQRMAALKWFENYQSIPLVGLAGQRTSRRFELMDLRLLRNQTVLDFGCNLGQACVKAAQAGASRVMGIEGMPDTCSLAVEIGKLIGFENLDYVNVDFNHPDFEKQIDGHFPGQADYSFFFSVYRTKELTQRDRLFAYIIRKTEKGIFFEGHAHPKIDTLEYYEWLFECFGLKHKFLGMSEKTLRPLFFLDLAASRGSGKSAVMAAGIPETKVSSSQAGCGADSSSRTPGPPQQGAPPPPSSSPARGEDSRGEAAGAAYLVSAIVATYKNERFMEGRLLDLLQQTLGERLEIVVVDSASPENEGTIVKRYMERYPNIRYIRTDQRETVYQSWNRGIRAASGKYIANANTDDRLRSDALEILAGELEAHPEIALVYGDFFITGFENMTFLRHIRSGYSIKPDYDPSIMLDGCHIGPQPMWRKSLHDELGWFEEGLVAAGDYEFWCRVGLRHPMKHLPEFLGLYLHNAKGVCNTNVERNGAETMRVKQMYAGKYPPPPGNLPRGFFYPGQVERSKYVNIGIITYNRLEYTKQAIEALVRNTAYPYVITVVDNASSDGTREYLVSLKKRGIIKNLVLLPENKGVAKARNIAWSQEPEAGYYLNLDNDIVIQKPTWLQDMVETIDGCPQLGVAGYNFEPKSFPITQLGRFRVRVKHEANIGGGCFFIPKRTEQLLGYWNEEYGLYGEEDVDYSVRTNAAGLLIGYMEDEDVGIHLPAGKAAVINSQTLTGTDGREEFEQKGYRSFKDQCRQRNARTLSINKEAFKTGRRPLYIGRGQSSATAPASPQISPLFHVGAAASGDRPYATPQSEVATWQAPPAVATAAMGCQVAISPLAAAPTPGQGLSPNVFPATIEPRAPKMKEGLLCSIIICVFNKWKFTDQCLKTVFQNTPRGHYEIIVIDNGSTDETQGALTKASSMLCYVRNTENVGFTLGCNQGAALAKGKYLVFLNNDTALQPGWLEHLVALAESDEKIGVVGAKLVFPDGRLQEAGSLIFQDGQGWMFGRGDDPNKPVYNQVCDVDFCSAACLLVRRDLFEMLGGFDRRYAPAYCEDSDLCFAARKAGYRVCYQPRAVVIHFENVTSAATDTRKYIQINPLKLREKWKEELLKQDPHPQISGKAPVTASRDRLKIAPVRKPGIKLTNDHKAGHEAITVGGESEFSRRLTALIAEHKFSKVIETGTYQATGTTRIIARALRAHGKPFAFYTIECNPQNYAMALRHLSCDGLLGAVAPLHGLSVPRESLPTMEEIRKRTIEEVEFDDIFIDHHEKDRALKYFAETNFDGIPDSLLEACLRAFDYKPDFVLLDSGGHMGNIEFNFLIERLEAPCHLALDDIHHIKHHKSFRQIRSDPRFELLAESREKFGFCLTRFTPRPFEPKHILWVRTDAVGDNVWAAGMLPHVRKKYPQAKITVLCNDQVKDLYETNPHINALIAIDKPQAFTNPAYLPAFCEFLRKQGFDYVLNSVFSREALIDIVSLAPKAVKTICQDAHFNNITPELKSHYDAFYTRIVPKRVEFEHESLRNRDFLRGIGIEAESCEPCVYLKPEDEAHAAALFKEHRLTPETTVALVVGVGRNHRIYNEYGTAIGEICRKQGLKVVALGTEHDRPLIQENLAALSDISLDLIGKTSVRQLAAFLKRCRLVVGAETGSTNMASALGVSNVVLMGGGDFGRFLPFHRHDAAACLPLACYGCGWHCRYQTPHCIRDVAPHVLRVALEQTLLGLGDKPRVFFQAAATWAPGKNAPAWQRPDSWLPPDRVEYVEVGDFPLRPDAVAEQTWLAQAPPDIQKVFQLAAQLAGRGNLQKACEILSKAAGQQPGCPQLSHQEAVFLLKASQPETARKILTEAVGRFPDAAMPQHLLTRVLWEMGERTAALTVCNQLLKLKPDDPIAVKNSRLLTT